MYKIYGIIPRPFIHRPFILVAFKILIYGKAYEMSLVKTIDGQNVIMIDLFNIYLFICSSIQIYSLGSIDLCHNKHTLKFVEIVTTKITPGIYCYEKMCFLAVAIMGC